MSVSTSSSSYNDFDAYKAKELAAKNLAEHKSFDGSYSPSGKDESPTLSPVSSPSPSAEVLNDATRDELATMRIMMMEMMKKMEEMETKESVQQQTSSNSSNASSSVNSRPCHQSTVPFIMGIGTAVPGIGRSQQNLVEGIITDFSLAGKTAALIRKIGKTSLVDWRYVTNPDRPAAASQHFEAINGEFEKEAPKLALRAAQEAIHDWGGNKNEITHVIGITCTGVLVPGIEFHVMRALDLPLTTQRLSIQFMGCFGCISGLKAAKAIAAEDPKHRVLVVCCELSTLHRQKSTNIDALVATLIFGDGVGAFIAGSNPRPHERPLYEIHNSISYIIPDTLEMMKWDLSEQGMVIRLAKEIPDKIYSNIEGFAKALFKGTSLEGSRYDEHYWAIHPGGPMIVQSITDELQLDPSKCDASYEVLRKYGNMSSATLVFVLNEMRKLYPKHKAGYTTASGKVYAPTSGWIPSVAFGPGLNVEGCLLRWTGVRDSAPNKQAAGYLSTVTNNPIKDADEETKAAWSIM